MAGPIDAYVFESREDFETAAANLLRDTLSEAYARPTAVLLSGGETPRPIYGRIEQEPIAVEDNVYIGFTDERHVAPEAPESNFGMSRGMIESLRVSEDRIIYMDTALALQEAAYSYHQNLAAFLDSGGHIPLAFLGIGADGHTCSLFTEADLQHSPGQLAIPVTRPTGPNRISVTPELLRKVARIVILAIGPEKADVAEILLTEPDSLIAGRALAGCPRVDLWIA